MKRGTNPATGKESKESDFNSGQAGESTRACALHASQLDRRVMKQLLHLASTNLAASEDADANANNLHSGPLAFDFSKLVDTRF